MGIDGLENVVSHLEGTEKVVTDRPNDQEERERQDKEKLEDHKKRQERLAPKKDIVDEENISMEQE